MRVGWPSLVEYEELRQGASKESEVDPCLKLVSAQTFGRSFETLAVLEVGRIVLGCSAVAGMEAAVIGEVACTAFEDRTLVQQPLASVDCHKPVEEIHRTV